MQSHGTLKDAHSVLRHASIQTTGDVYMQKIDESVVQAVNSRADAVLAGVQISTEALKRKGRNPKGRMQFGAVCFWGSRKCLI